MQDIDDRFLDVDFTKDPNYIFGDLGVNAFAKGLCGNYEDNVPLMTDTEIEDAMTKMDAEKSGGEYLITRIFNQGQEGSCVANATTQSNEFVQAFMFGPENVIDLSAISLYKRIGRSPGSGAQVSDGIAEMKSRGILPLDTPENRARFGDAVMPNTGFYTAYPSNWETTAKLFAGVEYDVISSVRALKTALCNNHPVVVGRQGHSICYCTLRRRNGRITAIYPNSWGNWGFAYGNMPYGFGADSESQISMSASWAFSLRTVVVPSK